MLTLHLEVRAGVLQPEENDGQGVPALAFAEVGQKPHVPGPLIRVPQGTEIRVSVRNPLSESMLTVYGLHTRPAAGDSGLRIPPGETGEVRFRAGTPGTYYYWGTTTGSDIRRPWLESQLSGALVIDSTNAPAEDRIFVIGIWNRPGDSSLAEPRDPQELMVINGKSWPHTERFGSLAGLGYVVQEGAAEPARDSIAIPGPWLVLRRGEPVRITVVNRLAEATAVHWHGIELESFPDGVPGWSGAPGRIMPPIAPADSFVAEFVPPRAGTFIYHTHSNEQLQMGAGLYGALLVVDPDRPYDPEIDKVILVGGAGPSDSLPQFDFQTPGLVNGRTSPPPMELTAGRTYRLRLININPDWRVVFSLMSDSGLVNWRPVAKDGADLPAVQRRERPAWLLTGPGETADFEFTPATPGELRLEVKTQLSAWIIPIALRVHAP